jgi:hypothetical protein
MGSEFTTAPDFINTITPSPSPRVQFTVIPVPLIAVKLTAEAWVAGSV